MPAAVRVGDPAPWLCSIRHPGQGSSVTRVYIHQALSSGFVALPFAGTVALRLQGPDRDTQQVIPDPSRTTAGDAERNYRLYRDQRRPDWFAARDDHLPLVRPRPSGGEVVHPGG